MLEISLNNLKQTPNSHLKTLLLTIALCSLVGSSVYGQYWNWTWMDGSNTADPVPDYGTQGTTASSNDPGRRDQACSWVDNNGKFWLFGGFRKNLSTNADERLDDLWKYDPTSGNWTWMKGTNLVSQQGTYGTILVEASSNRPGARAYASSWTDNDGNLWLFGGLGQDGSINYGYLNDLWKYNVSTNNWTWMKGGFIIQRQGVYGTKGIADSANTPGSRRMATSWTDNNGNLWLFGGGGFGESDAGSLNDLWKYDISTGNWTWVSGSKSADEYGTYGAQGTAAAANVPGARYSAVGWADSNNNLWMFGGYGYPDTGTSTGTGLLNDLWKYNISTGNWTWIKGSNDVRQDSTYGALGVASSTNVPGSRSSSCGWIDSSDNLWLFGGWQDPDGGSQGRLNDLWKFDLSSGNWTWMKGNNAVDQLGTYGTVQTEDPGNTPGARRYCSTWTDSNDSLWLFGGYGIDSTDTYGYLGDVWRMWESSLPVELDYFMIE